MLSEKSLNQLIKIERQYRQTSIYCVFTRKCSNYFLLFSNLELPCNVKIIIISIITICWSLFIKTKLYICLQILNLVFSCLVLFSHHKIQKKSYKTREGFLRKNIVAVSFFQNCAIHQYS